MTRVSNRVSWGLMAFLSVGVAGYAWWFAPQVQNLAPPVFANLFARPWLTLHVAAGGGALMIGAFQFLPAVRRRRPLHRLLGRIYAASCIAGGAAGIMLAFGTTAGPIAGLGFGLLGVAWIIATTQGWRAARAQDVASHRRWMIRSFSLTFAAVTLRLYLPLSAIAGLAFLPSYLAIAWLCWVPNLAAAELFLRMEDRRQPAVS